MIPKIWLSRTYCNSSWQRYFRFYIRQNKKERLLSCRSVVFTHPFRCCSPVGGPSISGVPLLRYRRQRRASQASITISASSGSRFLYVQKNSPILLLFENSSTECHGTTAPDLTTTLQLRGEFGWCLFVGGLSQLRVIERFARFSIEEMETCGVVRDRYCLAGSDRHSWLCLNVT